MFLHLKGEITSGKRGLGKYIFLSMGEGFYGC